MTPPLPAAPKDRLKTELGLSRVDWIISMHLRLSCTSAFGRSAERRNDGTAEGRNVKVRWMGVLWLVCVLVVVGFAGPAAAEDGWQDEVHLRPESVEALLGNSRDGHGRQRTAVAEASRRRVELSRRDRRPRRRPGCMRDARERCA